MAAVKESRPGENRVAVVPEVAGRLIKAGADVVIETGAGDAARFADDRYREAGASVKGDAVEAVSEAALVARVQAPTMSEVATYPSGVSVISFLQPLADLDVVRALAGKGATVYSLDLLPRISRAQSMDALSSQSTVAGYRAGLAAAEHLAKFFPMFMTAAGTVPPAKVLVMGAGVAGLQAIATARRLGAVVRAYDVRAAAKEEVQSLGAKFVDLGLDTREGPGGYAREQTPEELARQQELLFAEVVASDVVITTAQIPGRPAPQLVSAAMVEGMSDGAVVIDLAADSGGNCELTQPGAEVVVNGVTVVGMTNPASSMPTHASFLYARNVANFFELLMRDGALAPDFDDEIVAGTCVVREGTVVHGPTADALGGGTPAAPTAAAPSEPPTSPPAPSETEPPS
jgi:H+-translocating NAD(P) transhydrogenase subunit alpha